VLAVLAVSGGTSCRTSRKLADTEVRPMSANRIARRVVREAPTYKSYESKRIVINYNDGDNRNSFSGQFAIDNDKRIIVTLRKLNLPVGKLLITPDTVAMVNFFERYYMLDHISVLEELIGMEINYPIAQALLTADVTKIIGADLLDREMVSEIEQGMYRIDSQYSKKVDRAMTRANDRRLGRYMQTLDDAEFTTYSVWIDPRHFVVRKVLFNDVKNNEKITIIYDDYRAVGRSMFPQSISLEYKSPADQLMLDIKVTRPTVNKEKDFSFSIPEKYEKYRFSAN
jgi:hypothetical protein